LHNLTALLNKLNGRALISLQSEDLLPSIRHLSDNKLLACHRRWNLDLLNLLSGLGLLALHDHLLPAVVLNQ
jgi:hypothetical protein